MTDVQPTARSAELLSKRDQTRRRQSRRRKYSQALATIVLALAVYGGYTIATTAHDALAESPYRKCLAKPHSIGYCQVTEQHRAIRTLRRHLAWQAQRTRVDRYDLGRPLSWNLASLRKGNAWHRAELARLKQLPTFVRVKYEAAWLCIHRGEGAWNSNTGNGYYGGLQMDSNFQATYGSDMLAKYGGGAHLWTPHDQMVVAERAHDAGRGFHPWPNTARRCGLI